MKYTFKLMMVALALGTVTGCETWREQAEARGFDTVERDGGSANTGEDCEGCRRKWSAKPQGGVNAPPWGAT